MKKQSDHFKLCLLFLVLTTAIFIASNCNAQDKIFSKKVTLLFHNIDKDSSFNLQTLKLQSTFNNHLQAASYIKKVPQILFANGFPTASIDSISITDSTMHLFVYLGSKFQIVNLSVSSIEKKVLESVGYSERKNSKISFQKFQLIREQLLNYFENNGYPFASIFLDSIIINDRSIYASLKVEKGNYYSIDSLKILGSAEISPFFMAKYLDIQKKSPYNKSQLVQVDSRILELPFLTSIQPSDLTMLGTGAILNLYLKPKKASQVNFLIGLQPSNTNPGKLQLTGEVNLDLKNMFKKGERLIFKWQQLQVKSPRLNIGFVNPYFLKTSFGIEAQFEMFKKDSNYLQIITQLGIQYNISKHQFGKLFVQWQRNTLLSGGIDTNAIKSTKKLPVNIDVSTTNAGFSYEYNHTNYKPNPRIGNELQITSSIGTKSIKKNNQILEIPSSQFNYASLYDSIKLKSYQFRVKLEGAHYFPIGKSATLKTALNSGIYYSPDIFRNELFQIGGYKILRGFDEESIYASRYIVLTTEYRLLFGLNAHISFFSDYCISKYESQKINSTNNFLSAGIGLVYEAKVGLLNISYALGKRNDVAFNLREASKIHFGYINYF